MKPVAFDLDGTLFDSEGIDYEDPQDVVAKTKPNPVACRKTRALIEVGVPVHFITGRGRHLHALTLSQLRSWVHGSIAPDNLHTQEAFTGYEDMAAFKAERLRSIGAVGYCGDHEKDREAAEAAGVPFLHAESWRLA